MNMELIVWEDSALSYDGWVKMDELQEPAVMRVKSLGFVLRETDDLVELAPNVGGEEGVDQACQIIVIPKRCIVRRAELAEL